MAASMQGQVGVTPVHTAHRERPSSFSSPDSKKNPAYWISRVFVFPLHFHAVQEQALAPS
jgi:hypothetical protein